MWSRAFSRARAAATAATAPLIRRHAAGVALLASGATASALLLASPSSSSSLLAQSASSQPASSCPASPENEDGASTYRVNADLDRFLPERPSNLAVRGVVVVTRHGARTPMAFLPGQSKDEFESLWGNCPLGDHSRMPCARGLLTHLGDLQLSTVGWHLRERYVHRDQLLPTEFDPNLFRLRSTDLPRTQLSLARMLSGMYPGLTVPQLAPLVEVRKQADETLYPNHYHCPRLKEMFIEACHASMQSDPESYPGAARYKAMADSPEAEALRARFAAALNTPASELGTWVVIGDELKCRQAEGVAQVRGVTQWMSDRANELAEQTFWHILRAGEPDTHTALKPACPHSSELLYTDKTPLEAEVTRLGMGRLMKEIFTAMEDVKRECESKNKTASKPAPRFHIFSGHDTTLAPLLSALHAAHALMGPGQVSPSWPPLAGNVMLELLERTDGVSSAQPVQKMDEEDRMEAASADRPLEQSLAPLPPPATDDEEHHLPRQAATTKQPKQEKEEFSPHGAPSSSAVSAASSSAISAAKLLHKSDVSPLVRRGPHPAAPQHRWFLRLLVDHREISVLPLDDYKHVREAYQVKDWVEECKQKNEAVNGLAHHW